MRDMTIRAADMNDLKVLIGFEQEIIQAERAFDNGLIEGEIHYYNFQELLISPGAKVLIAEIENEIVGSGYAVLKAADSFLKFTQYAYIGLLYVKPNHRGNGINQLILEKLKDWVADKGVKEIRLVVYDDNEKAKNAYLKAGFKAHVLEMRMEI